MFVFNDQARASIPQRRLGFYVHVPFCVSRCGYCDFNTYTFGELSVTADQVSPLSPAGWALAVEREILVAAQVLTDASPIATVFFGGGTPSLVGADVLVRIVGLLREHWGFTDDVEVSVECNPESTSPEFFATLRAGGCTRVSLGMQSFSPHVLQVLERKHDPLRALQAVTWAHEAGFDHISVDLIYGTPGETDANWEESFHAALSSPIDHLSAYSLIVEQGTALSRKVAKGLVESPDDDVMAHRYWMLDEYVRKCGFSWYEVSNWSLPGGECRHNIGYWRGDNWWGLGPGAHSHIGGYRWWNVKHPLRYYQDTLTGCAVDDGEELSPAQQKLEFLMLRIRMKEGMKVAWFTDQQRAIIDDFIAENLLEQYADSVRLTDRGRLLADGIVRQLAED